MKKEMRPETIDLMPIRHERLSAEAFKKLVADSPSMIKSSRIVPPALGSNGFGCFEVEYSRPIYRALELAKASW